MKIKAIATRSYEDRLTKGKIYEGNIHEYPTGKFKYFRFLCDKKMNSSTTFRSIDDKSWFDFKYNRLNLNKNVKTL